MAYRQLACPTRLEQLIITNNPYRNSAREVQPGAALCVMQRAPDIVARVPFPRHIHYYVRFILGQCQVVF